MTVPAGGRGIDQDGNGSIDSTEGSSAAPPQGIISSRDALRQTVVDLMQLVRQIQAGIDVDGDGSVDLDAQRIYYAGQSFGGIYGTIFLGVEPALQAGVPNVAGGSIIEIVRLSPVFRSSARSRWRRVSRRSSTCRRCRTCRRRSTWCSTRTSRCATSRP